MIRQSQDGDIAQIIALASSVYKNLPYQHYGSREAWSEFIRNNHSLLCEDEGRIVAHGALEIMTDNGVLSRSFVDEAYRQKGIYSELVQQRIKKAWQHALGYLETYAATYTGLGQRILIERFGFIPVGIRLLDAEDVMNTGQRESLVVLRKPLTDTTAIPPEKPEMVQGKAPLAYDKVNGWQYAPIPDGFDPFKLRLHDTVKKQLSLSW